MFDIYIFAEDWIRTADLWIVKQPLYQLSHNNCPVFYELFCEIFLQWLISGAAKWIVCEFFFVELKLSWKR